MTFQLEFSGHENLNLNVGQTLFVVGANGTGKSSLLQRFASINTGNSRRISASRQTWFNSSAIEFSPSQKASYEEQARNWDRTVESRWMEQNAKLRSGLTLYDLIDAENVDARAIATAYRAGNHDEANRLAQQVAPIAKINELLSQSNIPIVISVEGGDRLVASKNGSASYGAAELSDGERNALLIAADVLTAKPETLLIIDEPERHLHRAIISPLLSHLFRLRKDCGFIVATHDLMLPIDNPDARVLLVRSCNFSGSNPTSWEADLLDPDLGIDDDLKQDIVGSRRRIVFVEGDQSSLDQPIYGVLFPDVSVRAKGSCKDVEQTVKGLRAAESVHWVRAWGIIDNDGRNAATIAELELEGIFALSVFSVESIYYHPAMIKRVAQRHANTIGGDGTANADKAIDAALAATRPHFDRLAARAVEKAIRLTMLANMPTMAQIETKTPVNVDIDTAAIVRNEREALDDAVQQKDWVRVLSRCPIRETPALNAIANTIGLRDRYQYESAVLQMLRDEPSMLETARSFFSDLPQRLEVD